jgi:hypothetical protein
MLTLNNYKLFFCDIYSIYFNENIYINKLYNVFVVLFLEMEEHNQKKIEGGKKIEKTFYSN